MTFCDKKIATAVWELTLRCNAKCIHCGSSAGCDRNNNLTFEQAKSVVKQLDELGCGILTLIGGEYFLYPQWKELLTELTKTKIQVGIVTNALALNEEKLDFLKQMNVRVVGISIDGATAATHDHIRGVPGCYENAWKVIRLAKTKKMPVTIITTINKLNIVELKEFRELMIQNNCQAWQLQHANLFGRMQKELAIDDFGYYCTGIFAAQTMRKYTKEKLHLFCMHDFGYYSKTIPNHVPNRYWTGCMAGRKNLGIRSDGSILGCLSLYDDKYVEGNVKEKSISEIRKNSCFCSWNHRLKKFKNLTGVCENCLFGLTCLGGCEASTPTQQHCYYAIEKKWKENTPQSPEDKILRTLTQGHMDKEGNFYLKDGTLLTDNFVNTLELDEYHKNILKIITS
ncbi:MAG: radical SAM protein [Alphaproteobacteria bacterium]|nr:radical SAM protein [Alphaproteobacteria bacterium]